jgi:hypothetical protein
MFRFCLHFESVRDYQGMLRFHEYPNSLHLLVDIQQLAKSSWQLFAYQFNQII